MSDPNSIQLQQRVIAAAEAVLEREGSVGILDVVQALRFLQPVHFQGWLKGNPYYKTLEPHIQCGEKKYADTMKHFLAWANEKKLEPFESTFQRNSRDGSQPLQLTEHGDPDREAIYRTRFRPADLSPAKKQRLDKKANKVADLSVYQLTSDQSACSECDAELWQGDLILLEDGKALCMQCADMDHLVMLPSENATLTRRTNKYSPLSAIVWRFNKRRKRYERQGILATQEAIDQAEEECAADADQRAELRVKAAARRQQADQQLVAAMTERILADFPHCPPEEAERIAVHTAERGSGRVGRSASGRALDQRAIVLAVQAWVRHQHTNYDKLLMKGVERLEARRQIQGELQRKLASWIAYP